MKMIGRYDNGDVNPVRAVRFCRNHVPESPIGPVRSDAQRFCRLPGYGLVGREHSSFHIETTGQAHGRAVDTREKRAEASSDHANAEATLRRNI
ncbi:hypothetical protein D9M72_539620 [compost metagenome]